MTESEISALAESLVPCFCGEDWTRRGGHDTQWWGNCLDVREAVENGILAAILAERKRCANIADENQSPNSFRCNCDPIAARDIADAIRRGLA